MTHFVSDHQSSNAFLKSIAEICEKESGIHLTPEKYEMMKSRLRHRLRARNFETLDAYTQFLSSKNGKSELPLLISALTTNVSHFFREPHHFHTLTKVLMPDIEGKMKVGAKIRIWSAGCSLGQEPYSIMMYMLRAAPELEKADFRILATDIDLNALNFAEASSYSHQMLQGVSDEDRSRFMTPEESGMKVQEKFRKFVSFKRLNLIKPWPMKSAFDAIFCRNVLIYFNDKCRLSTIPRFYNALHKDGALFLGHSERIPTPSDHGFLNIGPTSYLKV